MSSARILLADDDRAMSRLVSHRLSSEGHEVVVASDGLEAWERARAEPFDLIVADLRMPRLDGIGLLERLRSFDPEVPVLILTAHSSVATAVQAMKQGAWDYVEKPLDFERFRLVVGRALEHRRTAARARAADLVGDGPSYHGIVGRSRPVRTLVQMIERIAKYNVSVLVIGESGTGKELVARAIHAAGPRGEGPFVAINCAGIVDTLFESLFFGHEKGSFTGAQQASKGWMGAASGGVLFLDEIGELPLGQQAKLLRALETREITPVGATKPVPVDVRVVAATNRDLRQAIEEKQFREDLFYRLRGVELRVPSLSERRDDVALLAQAFLERANAEFGRSLHFEADAVRALEAWAWPGNVRELRQVVFSAVMLSDGPLIRRSDILLDQRPSAPKPAAPAREPALAAAEAPAGVPLALDDLEREHLDRVLALAAGNKSKAAELLGVSRHALYRMMRRHGRR